MELNNIEQRYRDSFHNRETSVDTNEIWDNIEGEIEKKEKRRFFFWIFGGFLILLITVSITSYQLLMTRSDDASLVESRTKTEVVSSKEETKNEKEVIDEVDLKNENKGAGAVANDEQFIVLNENNSSKNNSAKKESPKPRPFSQAKSPAPRPVQPQFIAPPKSGMSQAQESKKEIEEQSQKATGETGKTQAPKRYDFKKSKTPRIRKSIIVPDEKQLGDKETLDRNPVIPQNQDSEKKTFQTTDRDSIENTEKPLAAQVADSGQSGGQEKTWSSSIAAYAEIGLLLRQFASRRSTGDTLTLTQENSAKSLDEFGAGINYKLQHKKGWLLVTGLNYQQITEKLTFYQRKAEEFEVDTVISYTINALQDTIATYGTVSTIEITERNKISYNRYRMLNLPLGIGRSFKVKKIKMDVVAGLDVNFFYRPTGNYIGYSEEPIDIETAFNKKSIGFGLFGTFTLGLPLNEKWQLNISPGIKQQLSSMASKDYPLKQRYTILSLRVGVQYDF